MTPKPKALFIDRDGTLIREPLDEQIDTLEKLEFLPGVFRNLYYIRHLLGYKLIMVSNQDGLGTEKYPQARFEQVQEKILQAFANEGITFDDIRIDPSTAANPSPNRKPNPGMIAPFLDNGWDWEKSYVVGDRLTDVELAHNTGMKAIYLGDDANGLEKKGLHDACALAENNWDAIFGYLLNQDKSANVRRKSKETAIDVNLHLLGSGKAEINTGLGFFDHMLEQLVRHGGFDLQLQVRGDLKVDEHHTIEDTGLALGEALGKALANKRGLQRFGFNVPMDESMARVSLDFSGRPWLVWDADFKREKVGDMPTEMFMHFFKSLSDTARLTLNIEAVGSNEHHKIEAIFKATGRALKSALRRDWLDVELPTTKGML